MLLGGLLAGGCLDATQVKLELTTDVNCTDEPATTITVGQLGEFEEVAPAARTQACSSGGGRVGSIVVVPSGSAKGSLGVQVVMGIDKSPEQCVEDDFVGGCIVARRSLGFVQHRGLFLPVELEAACIDVPCGATETCRNGICVDAEIRDLDLCLREVGCDVELAGGGGGGGGTGTGGAETMSGAGGGSSGEGSGGQGSGGEGSGGLGSGGGAASCGDGVLDPFSGELCDDAGPSASCNGDCTPSRCGDGQINSLAGEFCDATQERADCDQDCTEVECGDGYVNYAAGEECEVGMGSCTDCRLEEETGPTPLPGMPGVQVVSRRKEGNTARVSFDGAILSGGQAAADWTLRYFYTDDPLAPPTTYCNEGNTSVGCMEASITRVAMSRSCELADTYVQAVYTGALGGFDTFEFGVLNAGAQDFDFSNDYSRANHTGGAWETASNVALYQGSTHVWGDLPCPCGDGLLAPDEDCDHGGESAYCNADCTTAVCGDGVVNFASGEQCDPGQVDASCDDQCRSLGWDASVAPILWLDASRLDAIELSVDGVSEVRDLSGQNNHLTQLDGAKQPRLIRGALGRDRYGLWFDGVDDSMSAASSVTDLSEGAVFLVHLLDPTQPAGIEFPRLLTQGATGGISVRVSTVGEGVGLAFESPWGPDTIWGPFGEEPANGQRFGISYVGHGGGNRTVGQRGLLVTQAAPALMAPLGVLALSDAMEPFRGAIGEIIVLDGYVHPGVADSILRYLHAKWTPTETSLSTWLPPMDSQVPAVSSHTQFWDRDLVRGAGTIVVRRATDLVALGSIPVSDTASFVIAGDQSQINVDVGLSGPESIEVVLPAGAVLDDQGRPNLETIWRGSIAP